MKESTKDIIRRLGTNERLRRWSCFDCIGAFVHDGIIYEHEMGYPFSDEEHDEFAGWLLDEYEYDTREGEVRGIDTSEHKVGEDFKVEV